MSDFEKRIIIYLSVICLVCGISFMIYKQFQISNMQKEIESSMVKQKDLGDAITRSMSQYATSKDIDSMIKANGMDLAKINKDLQSLHAKVDSINTVLVSSIGYDWNNLPSSGHTEITPHNGVEDPVEPTVVTVPCGDKTIECLKDRNNYFTTTQWLKINELFKGNLQVPFGQAGFTAAKDKPWSLDVLPREYKLSTVTATDEDNRVTNYNKMQIKVDGKDYDIPISQAETAQVFPEAKFRVFDPRLYLGVEGGANDKLSPQFGPSLSMSLMNYGRYRGTPDFAILQVGAMATIPDKKIYFSLTPVSYNIGKHIPFIQSTYLGASVNMSTDKDLSITASVKVGL
jgi:hypothetical protein